MSGGGSALTLHFNVSFINVIPCSIHSGGSVEQKTMWSVLSGGENAVLDMPTVVKINTK